MIKLNKVSYIVLVTKPLVFYYNIMIYFINSKSVDFSQFFYLYYLFRKIQKNFLLRLTHLRSDVLFTKILKLMIFLTLKFINPDFE